MPDFTNLFENEFTSKLSQAGFHDLATDHAMIDPNNQPPSNPTKVFKVASVSSNANSFGLTGHVLVAKDGDAWEVGRSRGSWNDPWDRGTSVTVKLDDNGRPQWAGMGVEIPKRLSPAPPEVVAEVWASAR